MPRSISRGPQGEPLFEVRYSDDQPRDPDGKFASGGSPDYNVENDGHRVKVTGRALDVTPELEAHLTPEQKEEFKSEVARFEAVNRGDHWEAVFLHVSEHFRGKGIATEIIRQAVNEVGPMTTSGVFSTDGKAVMESLVAKGYADKTPQNNYVIHFKTSKRSEQRYSEDQPRDPDGKFASGGTDDTGRWSVSDDHAEFNETNKSRLDSGEYKIVKVEAAKVQVDFTYPERVEQYASAMSKGDKFPMPVGVSNDGGKTFWVPNGNHRVAAAKSLGDKHIYLMVRKRDVNERSLEQRGFGPQGEPLFEVRYSEDQPRDEHGRWTDGGGGLEPKLVLNDQEHERMVELYKGGASVHEIVRQLGKPLNGYTRTEIRERLREAGIYKERGGIKPAPTAEPPVTAPPEPIKAPEAPPPPPPNTEAATAAFKEKVTGETGLRQVVNGSQAMVEGGISADVIRAAGVVSVEQGIWGSHGENPGVTGLYSVSYGYADSRMGLRTTLMSGGYRAYGKADKDTFIHEFGHHITLHDAGLANRLNWDRDEFNAARVGYMQEFNSARIEAQKSGERGSGKSFNLDKSYFQTPRSGLKHAPTAYSLKNDHEWRAEAFMLYYGGDRAREGLKARCPATYEYIHKVSTNGFKTRG